MQEYIKKILGYGRCHSSSLFLCSPSSAPKTTTLIISNDEIKDIIEIVKSLKDSVLLLKRVSETIQNEAKEQKGRFLSMLLDTLDASLFGNNLAGKGAIVTTQGRGVNRAREGAIVKRQCRKIARAGYGSKKV